MARGRAPSYWGYSSRYWAASTGPQTLTAVGTVELRPESTLATSFSRFHVRKSLIMHMRRTSQQLENLQKGKYMVTNLATLEYIVHST